MVPVEQVKRIVGPVLFTPCSSPDAIYVVLLSHVPEPVCKTASDWISQRSPDALGEFVLWCIDSIMSELSSPTVGPKGAKKVVQQTPKAQRVKTQFLLERAPRGQVVTAL
ncbi:hypothetical protein ACQJBY_012640 [Aegilops geniculata]